MFSPHQMHPECSLRYAASAAMEALARQGSSLQSMLHEHGLGLVIVASEVDYEEEALTFFSGTSMTTEVRVSLRDDGRLLIFRARHSVPAGPAISITVRARPVKLSGGAAMDAAPAAIEGALRACFAADEIEAGVPSRVLQSLIDSWVAGGEELGAGEHSFFIGRSDCELADQWQFVRLPSLVATTRERVALSDARALSVSLKKPLRAFRGEYFRPMYLGDSGRIEFKAFRKEARTYFVYRVLGALVPGASEEQRPVCAIAAEVF